MHLQCIHLSLWASPTFPSLLFTSRVTSFTNPSMMPCSAIQTLQKHDLDHRNHRGGWAQDGSTQMCKLAFNLRSCWCFMLTASHWNSVLAQNVKCIPEVYWFFTPLQKRYVLCALKVVWDTYRYFMGPSRESQKMRQRHSWLAGTMSSRHWERVKTTLCLLKEISGERNSDRAVVARSPFTKIYWRFVSNFLAEIKHLCILPSTLLQPGMASKVLYYYLAAQWMKWKRIIGQGSVSDALSAPWLCQHLNLAGATCPIIHESH